MRILITGAGGQVGRELVAAFADHEVLAPAHIDLDVADRDQVLAAVVGWQPDALVHAAAWTDVDGCEGDIDRAFAVNALGPRHLAQAARMVGASVCHLSTDYVFSGDQPGPYSEWDDTGPRSVYGRSKLGGERELGPDATVVRTSWVNGLHGRNFVKTMLRLADQGGELSVVDDQHGCPTFADDLAGMVRRLVLGRFPGVFHVTNQGATTWYALARDVLAAAGHDPERVRPVATSDLRPARPAPRPANSVLDNAALRLCGLPLLADHHEPLERLVKELVA
ncbi:MAG: dTDP-4-dehydrorhamnose reductase [Acidimicrobiales bacterium]